MLFTRLNALKRAQRDHRAKLGELQKERAAIDKKLDTEEARWKAKEEELESALRQARAPTYLRLLKVNTEFAGGP